MNFIKKIRENLKNPKKKSLTLICIYLIFFIIVFLLISSAELKQPLVIEDENKEEINSKVDSYEYTYKVFILNNILELTGTHKILEDLFIYNGLKYYKNDKNLYLYQDSKLIEIQPLDINIDNYSYDTIEEMIKYSELVDETTYSDKSRKTTYSIYIDDFFDIINMPETNLDLSIPLVVIYDDYISDVSIDLSSFYNYKYLIEIKYQNVNKIDKIKISAE